MNVQELILFLQYYKPETEVYYLSDWGKEVLVSEITSKINLDEANPDKESVLLM